jgi:acetate kinase
MPRRRSSSCGVGSWPAPARDAPRSQSRARRYVLATTHLKRPIGELRIVTLHLGNGASACAVELGHSTETSMGMTPLDGLVMGTRSGEIDPGAILALLGAGWDAARIDRCLNRESGLSGLSGVGNDLRDIERRAAEGDDRCRLAITVFSHRVRKYIGAYAATMGGLDAVVLTGGIGENSITMRQRILQRFEFLGLVLDEDRNASVKLTDEAPAFAVTAEHSRITALAVKTNEELLARQAVQVLRERERAAPVGPIPIAVSARHLHLTKETFAELFGADASPTHLKDISQPGQFACKETVTIIGPRGKIEADGRAVRASHFRGNWGPDFAN